MEVNYSRSMTFGGQSKRHVTGTLFLRWSYRVSQGIVILALGVGVTLFAIDPHNSALRNLAPLYILLMLWILWFYGAPYLSARSQFRGSPSARTSMTLEASDAGLHFRSEYSDSRIAWSAFVRWVDEKAVFTLFPNPRIFIVVPKRAFRPDQINEFRELLRSRIKAQS